MGTVNLSILNAPPAVVSVLLCINKVTCRTVVDSGSTCSLILETLPKKLKTPHEKSLKADGQMLNLTKGEIQTVK